MHALTLHVPRTALQPHSLTHHLSQLNDAP